MDYWPNVDAVTYFVKEILPRLAAQLPKPPVFYIVGNNPSPQVRQLASPGSVVVTGRVEDVRPYLRHALAAVAPLRIARGVQNKVLEAMAMARPVIASSMGLEGIEASHGSEVLVADSEEEYVTCIRQICAGEYTILGNRARALIERDFCWATNLAEIDYLFD
jgi:glycosyltransferase involved in cell wall biosynthesis